MKDIANLDTTKAKNLEHCQKELWMFANIANVAKQYWNWVLNSQTMIRLLTELEMIERDEKC